VADGEFASSADAASSLSESADALQLQPADGRFAIARQWGVRVAAAMAITFALARVLAVDIAGIVTNDSLGYLRRSEDLFSEGLLAQGYRQVGYPLFIAFSNGVGDALGWDHIFGVAFLQRMCLLLSLAALIWAARWWSAPAVLVATSATYVLLADFILVEGLVIACCIASGALLTATTYGRISTRTTGTVVLIGSALVALVAGGLKLQFASLLALTAAVGWVLVKDGVLSRRLAVISTLLVGGLIGAQSIENHRDLGTFEPIAERQRSMWWGAWQAVFILAPENRDNPALAEYYDGGNLYTYLHGVERDVPDYLTRRDMILERTEAMLDAAGTSMTRERIAAFLGAIQGGRSDDLAGVTQRVLGSPLGDAMIRVEPNRVAQAQGADAVLAGFNDGFAPGVVTAGPLLDPAQRYVNDYRGWIRWLSPVAIAGLIAAAIFGRRERPAAIGVLAMLFASSAAMASGFTDNSRYLVGPLTVVLIGGTNAVREFALDAPRWWQRNRGITTVANDTNQAEEDSLLSIGCWNDEEQKPDRTLPDSSLQSVVTAFEHEEQPETG